MNSGPSSKFDVVLSKDVAKYVDKLDDRRKRQIYQVLTDMATDPLSGDIETIKGSPGYFRRRIGRYRLKFKLIIETKEVKESPESKEPGETKEIREIHVLEFGPRGDFRF